MHERQVLQDQGAAGPHHNHRHGVPSSDALGQHQLVALAIVHQVLRGCGRISQQPGLGGQPGIPDCLVGLCTGMRVKPLGLVGGAVGQHPEEPQQAGQLGAEGACACSSSGADVCSHAARQALLAREMCAAAAHGAHAFQQEVGGVEGSGGGAAQGEACNEEFGDGQHQAHLRRHCGPLQAHLHTTARCNTGHEDTCHDSMLCLPAWVMEMCLHMRSSLMQSNVLTLTLLFRS